MVKWNKSESTHTTLNTDSNGTECVAISNILMKWILKHIDDICTLVVGGIAIVFSALSMSAADSGQVESARSYGKAAMGLGIAALVMGTVTYIVLIVLVASY